MRRFKFKQSARTQRKMQSRCWVWLMWSDAAPRQPNAPSCAEHSWTHLSTVGACSHRADRQQPGCSSEALLSHKSTKHKAKVIAAAQWRPHRAKVRQGSATQGGCGWTRSARVHHSPANLSFSLILPALTQEEITNKPVTVIHCRL